MAAQNKVRVKICGITNPEDALAAVEAGADALGFVFAPSPRRITAAQAAAIIRELPPFVTTVGLVVGQDPRPLLDECPLDAIQYHGSESPEAVAACPVRSIKAFRISSEADLDAIPRFTTASAVLLDAYVPGVMGGTGKRFPWDLALMAKRFGKPVIVAGGLSPETVPVCVSTTQPYAVDVSSGVEAELGRKDHAKVRAFVRAVQGD